MVLIFVSQCWYLCLYLLNAMEKMTVDEKCFNIAFFYACLQFWKKKSVDISIYHAFVFAIMKINVAIYLSFLHLCLPFWRKIISYVFLSKVDGRSARGRPRFGWMDGVKRSLNDRMMDIREASEHARNRNEWRMIVTQFWLASAVATGLPYRGNPVVGAVGEMAYMKRHKLWKTGEDGLCCSSSAIQTRLGPSSLLEEWSEIPIVCVVGYPPDWGKRPRYIDRYRSFFHTFVLAILKKNV